jgi:hypothetical protein
MPEMSLGDASRRFDALAEEVQGRLANGPPLLATERHALARSVTRLLPVIAAGFPRQEDKKSSGGLGEEAAAVPRSPDPLAANRTDDESDWT